jgi:hypothetical protein
MIFPFVSRSRVLNNLIANSTSRPTNSDSTKRHPTLLIVAGAQDRLMTVPIMKRLANMYAATNVGVGVKTTLGVRNVSSLQQEFTSGVAQVDEAKEVREGPGGVWFAEIEEPGAGHNLMRDDGWEKCARVVEAFLQAST